MLPAHPLSRCLLGYLCAALLGGLAAGPAGADTLNVKVSDQSGKPLVDAVVMALPARPAPPVRPRPRPMAIEQKDREFLPFVTAVQVGTAVTFPNRDPLLHHVYSFSPAKVFEIKLYTGDSPSVLFDKPGPVALGCNIHDWMEAHIYVSPTPYFAKTDAQGQAHITLPAGSYALETWHPYQNANQDAVPAAGQVQVAGTQSAALTVPVTVPQRKIKPPHDPNQY